MLRRRAVGRTFPAGVLLAVCAAFLVAASASPSLAEPVGGAGGTPDSAAQASSELGLIPAPPRPSITKVDAGTHEHAEIGLLAVLGAGVAVWLLPVRHHRSRPVVAGVGLRRDRSSRPRAPPVTPAV